jgi:hypothetical protein
MTSDASQLPVPRQGVIDVHRPTRALALRPALALMASKALPAVTASVAAAATVLTAERAVRGVAQKLTPTRPEPVTPAQAVYSTTRTVVTEWLTVERRRRAR